LRAVPSYLQRSGSYFDLDIDIYKWEKSHPQNHITLIQEIAHDIIPHFHRIRSMSAFCFSETTCRLILHYILRAAAAPNLQQLQIKFDQPTFLTRPEGFKILEQGSPRLQFLRFEQADCLPVPQSLCNLTTLHLHYLHPELQLSFQQLVEVLTSPNTLLYLSLQGDLNFATWPLHLIAPEFQLNHLKALRLSDNGMMAVRMLLSMSAPKLNSIWLDCSYDNFGFLFDASQMSGTHGRSKFPNLQYLTLPMDNLTRMIKFAKIFPSITHLHLPYPDFYYAIHLQTALTNHWTSLHTVVFTMLKGTSQGNLNPCFSAVLPYRRQAGRPIKHLLLDRDFFQNIRKSAPELIPQVEMEIISASNYKEAWWNKEDLAAAGVA